MLAVIHSDVKKLIKCFKLDRRKQNDEGADNNSVPESDNAMLEQIVSAIKEIAGRESFTEKQTAQMKEIATTVAEYICQKNEDANNEIKALLEAINIRLEGQQAVPQKKVTRHEHYFTIDFRNSKAAITMTVMALIILVSAGLNIHQVYRNSDLRDNDIKYRYIKMQGKASAEELYHLRGIFEFDRNTDSMKVIRRRVERYEQLLKEYNETQYRKRQDEACAREIEQEAATVKGNK